MAVVDHAWTELRLAEDAEEPDDRRRHVTNAISILSSIGESDADVFYALGYAWYHHPDILTSATMRARSVAAFRAAVERDSHHALAHLYLGHSAFDQGDDAEAIREFESAAGGLDKYLEVKRREMLICCAIRMQGIAGAMADLGTFSSWLQTQSVYDIHPANLANALRGARSELASLSATHRLALSEIVVRLDHG